MHNRLLTLSLCAAFALCGLAYYLGWRNGDAEARRELLDQTLAKRHAGDVALLGELTARYVEALHNRDADRQQVHLHVLKGTMKSLLRKHNVADEEMIGRLDLGLVRNDADPAPAGGEGRGRGR